jgi:transcriptional regulator with XRE-family HTH domain
MMFVGKNIRYLRNLKNLSQEALSEQLGITRARLVTYENERNEPPVELLVKLSEHFSISLDVLVKGDLMKTNPEAMMKVGKNRILFPVIIDKEGQDLVEVIPEKASAGYLRGYSDPEYIEGLQRMKLPFLPAGKHRAFPIKGDSMPPLSEGSYVIGKYVDSFTDVRDGNTYVLLTRNEGIVYKRLYRNHEQSDALMLHSDNKIYPPYSLKSSEVLEIWEYTCSINTSPYAEEELNLESIMGMMRELKIELERVRR